jgi:hypothetical protein
MTARLKLVSAALLLAAALASAQSPPLNSSGQLSIDGHTVNYIIRRLPPSSFPSLPAAVVAVLEAHSCLIPQSYQAHQPENVVHASLANSTSADWAVLCSSSGTTSLLVFFAADPSSPSVLATAPETERLALNTTTGVYGFDWAIDPASPGRVREAQLNLHPRPPAIDHDALADSVIDRRTIYHFFSSGAWTLLDLPER